MIPKHIITTWICDPARDRYNERHRDMFQVCIGSWLRLMPDYRITIVTYGDMMERQSRSKWVEARLDEGNFIGASQWARLDYLYEYGGIFLDADVEAVRRFDSLLDGPFTIGHLGNGQKFANNAIMASPAHHPFLVEQMYAIRKADPKHPDFGNHTGPFMITELLWRRGWSGLDRDETVDLGGDMGMVHVRGSSVFHPYNFNQSYTPECIQPDTLAVHHWASSWKKPEDQTTHAWR